MRTLNKSWRQRLFGGYVFVVRVTLGCLFIYSSIPKMRQPYDFLSNVYEYEIVGPKLGLLVAMTLPWLELLVGICLVGGIFLSGALLATIAMAAMFTFVIASALSRGLQISCGCFGSHGDVMNYSTLLRTCMILFFSVGAYVGVVISRPCAKIPDVN